ncbi:MAG: nuclear transport factor 2 family protein [Thiotrichales bacterium]|nr:nuclear transport factor 2 family protein [Thiotrichales bacterium]
MSTLNDAIRSTIYEASLALDECRWDDWLSLCDDEFYYAIKAYSPEIHYDMIYLDGNRAEMVSMCELLPKHNTDHSPLSRHTVVYRVEVDEEGASASAVSSVAVHRTVLDGMASHVEAGSSGLFLVGKYHDRFRIDGGNAKFMERIVRLDTRRLDKGTHWPI